MLLLLFFLQRFIKLITPDLTDKEANQIVLPLETNGDEILSTSTL